VLWDEAGQVHDPRSPEHATADRARRTPYFKLAVICRGIAAAAAGGAMLGLRIR
jgi:hypothetical protein